MSFRLRNSSEQKNHHYSQFNIYVQWSFTYVSKHKNRRFKNESRKKEEQIEHTAKILLRESKFKWTKKEKEEHKKSPKEPKVRDEVQMYKCKWSTQWIESTYHSYLLFHWTWRFWRCFLCPPIESNFVSNSQMLKMWWNAHCRFAVTLSVCTSTFIAPIICSHCVFNTYDFFLSLFSAKKEVFSFFAYFSHFFRIMFVHGAIFNDTDFEFKAKIELKKN